MGRRLVGLLFLSMLVSSCDVNKRYDEEKLLQLKKGSYGYDLSYLKKHTQNVIELTSADGQSKLALSAQYQGRVFTSTADGDSGKSFGWLNYDLLAATEAKRQFNAVGGEERFWLGPEGGQYSIYFKPGDSFLFKNWQVPAFIDTETYSVENADSTTATFSKKAQLKNYSGTIFDLQINRRIVLRQDSFLEKTLNVQLPQNVHCVGYSSENILTNTGNNSWQQQGGMLSIWLLGMFTPTPETFVIIPFQKSGQSGKLITDNYFGEIPASRLQKGDSLIYFRCDGNFRSKIGIHPAIAKPLALAFDFENNVLTIVIPQIHQDKPYVNSKWEIQSKPFEGDAVNAYNDGPLEDGTKLGPFFEIESSSPALALDPGESALYQQSTFHLTGEYNAMRNLVLKISGADLDEIKKMPR